MTYLKIMNFSLNELQLFLNQFELKPWIYMFEKALKFRYKNATDPQGCMTGEGP